MSTSAFAGSSIRAEREWKRSAPPTQLCSVSTKTSVGADRHRIFQALTVAEYIEAWFSVPGGVADHIHVFTREDFFSINISSTQRQHIGILCSYKVCRRSKLLFTWAHNALSETALSLVNIRLLGDFGRTTVQVTHSGLAPSDQPWHLELWQLSLAKLRKLF